MRFLGILLLTVSVLVAVGWWVLGDGAGTRPVIEAPPVEPPRADPPTPEPDPRAVLVDRETVQPAADPVPQPVAGPAAGSLFPIRVEVTDGATGAPVADLELEMRDRGRHPELTYPVTDGEGVAEVLWSGDSASVVARWQGYRLSYPLADSHDGVLTIRLESSVEVEVLALRDGRPVADLPVWVQDHARLLERPDRGIVRTDASGRAKLTAAPPAARPPRTTLHVIADVIAEPSVSVAIPGPGDAPDPASVTDASSAWSFLRHGGPHAQAQVQQPESISAGPGGALILNVPPTGRLDVTVEPEGVPGQGHIAVAVATRGQVVHHPANVHRQFALSDRKATAPRVELGREVRVEAFLADGFRADPVLVDGPLRSDRPASATLQAHRNSILMARVLSGDAPLIGVELDVELVTRNSEGVLHSRMITQVTDPNGRVQWSVDPSSLETTELEELVVGRRDTHQIGGVSLLRVKLERETRLPDIRLEDKELLADGVVTGPDSEPLEGVTVHLSPALVGWYPGAHVDSTTLSATTDATGRFALYATPDRLEGHRGSHPAKLGATGMGFLPHQSEVKLPARDQRFVLVRSAQVRLPFDVEHPEVFSCLVAHLVATGSGDRQPSWSRVGRTSGSWSSVPPGEYRIEVHCNDLGQELGTVGPFTVLTAEDVLLPAFQVEGLRPVQVRVLDEAGELVPGARGTFQLNGEQKVFRGSHGSVYLLEGNRPTLTVRATGHQTVQVVVDGDQDVVLGSSFQVRLRLRNLPEGFPNVSDSDNIELRYLMGRLYILDDSHDVLQWSHHTFDENGEVLVEFPGPGRYRIQLPVYGSGELDIADTEIGQLLEKYIVPLEIRASDNGSVVLIDYPDRG